MRIICRPLFSILVFGLVITRGWADNVEETALEGPDDVKIKIRMEGPTTAETPLQVVCLFKHKESGDKMLGAAVELDKELLGAISSLRNRGEFVGEALETLLIVPPAGTIKPKLLLRFACSIEYGTDGAKRKALSPRGLNLTRGAGQL